MTQNSWKRSSSFWVAVFIGLGGGCGSAAPTTQPVKQGSLLDALVFPKGTNPKTAHNIEQQTIRDCMAKAGFEYIPAPYVDPAIASGPAPSQVAEWGFGFSTTVGRTPPWAKNYDNSVGIEPANPLERLTPDERRRYGAAMGGANPGAELIDDQGGCAAKGFASSRRSRSLRTSLTALYDERNLRVSSDPQLLAARTKQTKCWNSKGYDKDPGSIAFDKFNALTAAGKATLGAPELKELQRWEITAALNAQACAKGVDGLELAITHKVESQLIAQHPELTNGP